MDKLNVGDNIKASHSSWAFSGEVSKTFSEHVKKSVPLYEEGQELISQLSDFFLNDGSVCYDLGTSTGKIIASLLKRHKNTYIKYIGIDIEKDMLKQARKEFEKDKLNTHNVSLLHDDILTADFEKADLIVAYYTVQFIHPKQRQDLITKIYESLNWGGAFILFEKVRASDARFQDITTQLYNEYKLEQGYTPEEVIGKSISLKGVLEPFSTEGNLGLLNRAGFVDIMTVMKHVNFEGFLAIK